MEHLGAVQEVGWSSFDAGMPVAESEIMAQMFGPCSFARGDDHDDVLAMPSTFWMEDYANFYICSDSSDSGSYQWPQVCTSDSTSTLFSIPSEGESYCLSELNAIPVTSGSLSEDFCCDAKQTTPSASHIVPSYLNEEATCEGLRGSLLKRKLDILEDVLEDDRPLSLKIVEIPSENPKKKNQASAKTQKSAKTVRSKKTPKKIETGNEEGSIAALNRKSPSFCSSEDDSNAFQELNERGGKTRADHGSATDPQSLYARKRRERINERLKILQNLVPNGTKVDISTMLEEAVQYVKFLQLQIKLLSSDDMWMYAPIAYNGMDISINLNISPK